MLDIIVKYFNYESQRIQFMDHESFDYTDGNRNWIVEQILDQGRNLKIENRYDSDLNLEGLYIIIY